MMKAVLAIGRNGMLIAALSGIAGPVLADPSPEDINGIPAQIIPSISEVGAPSFTVPDGSPSFGGATGGTTGPTGGTGTTGGSAMDAMMATEYGSVAVASADDLGVNPAALAGIGEVESGFQNIPTSNGSSSATGPWQITAGTWDSFVTKYGLPYSSADMIDPTAQATVASYIIRDYGGTISEATGQPATVLQTYGAYLFGPSYGATIASAASSTPLSNIVPASYLSNNGMTGWTVGQFNATIGAKLGSTASQTVILS